MQEFKVTGRKKQRYKNYAERQGRIKVRFCKNEFIIKEKLRRQASVKKEKEN